MSLDIRTSQLPTSDDNMQHRQQSNIQNRNLFLMASGSEHPPRQRVDHLVFASDCLGNGPCVGAPSVFSCIDHYNSSISTNDDSIPDRSVCNIHIHMGIWRASLAELSYTIA